MAAIKGKDTKPELIVRRWLHREGFRFRLHPKNLPGKPDLVLPKYGTAILVHGCFWHSHGCANSVVPKTRREFWQNKLAENRNRDAAAVRELRKLGWLVEIVWECELRRDPSGAMSKITRVLERRLRP